MAATTAPLDEARSVLTMFDWFGRQAGEVLVLGNLITVGHKRGMTSEDVEAGLDAGHRQGWFESLPDKSIMLTQAGSAALRA